jgi:hypothetical protein
MILAINKRIFNLFQAECKFYVFGIAAHEYHPLSIVERKVGAAL